MPKKDRDMLFPQRLSMAKYADSTFMSKLTTFCVSHDYFLLSEIYEQLGGSGLWLEL